MKLRILVVYVELPEGFGEDASIERTFWFDMAQAGVRLPETHLTEHNALLSRLEDSLKVKIDPSPIYLENHGGHDRGKPDPDTRVDTYELLDLVNEETGAHVDLKEIVVKVNQVFEAMEKWYRGSEVKV